jgi:glutamyl-tRNA synthetase
LPKESILYLYREIQYKMSKPVRVRFAPSPTGPLHIGGVRTALFNYLFAKKHNGTFILRIEDTDRTRLVEAAEEYINKSLEWLGLPPDEGVRQGGPYSSYKQSERKDIYKPYADELIRSGWAYYAFDTPEELDRLRKNCETSGNIFSYDIHSRFSLNNSLKLGQEKTRNLLESGKPYVIRFKMPENFDVQTNDLIRGTVHFNTSTLDDKVIFKSDGLPTYHLAHLVDDYLMKISHVIRGEEWLPSFPLHVMLYKAFGWEEEMPLFAHLPLILKPNGKGKLSKRDGDKDGFPVFPLEWTSPEGEISSGYRESGYFPEAVINILALLGWNPGTDQEIFSLNELIDAFSFDRVNKAGARFDPEKAKWFNQQYLQKKDDSELAGHFSDMLIKKGIQAEKSFLVKLTGQIKERAVFINDFWEQASFYFVAPQEYDDTTVKKFWKEDTGRLITACLTILKAVEPFTASNAEAQMKAYIESNVLGFGKVMNPLRLAIVGAARGPHLFDIMEMIGKEETIRRIERAIEYLK